MPIVEEVALFLCLGRFLHALFVCLHPKGLVSKSVAFDHWASNSLPVCWAPTLRNTHSPTARLKSSFIHVVASTTTPTSASLNTPALLRDRGPGDDQLAVTSNHWAAHTIYLGFSDFSKDEQCNLESWRRDAANHY
ncbi:hypothetical protein K402DRAFT_397786 [Aulographum hederae CBS 113979]|uniref:Secreted protein n=1 Tax=Aulographum hederae CBS 113979 TaxID=1176131 RepID=A0A6G1GMZ0_9PEZI|nr:hypothetical protein K402DRAFT_397786 [Aulographum hederae CBS 113979]